jgi:transmembrane sensor
MENTFEIQQIVIKHLRQEILSPQEKAILEQFLATTGGKTLVENFQDSEWVSKELARIEESSTDEEEVWQKIQGMLVDKGFAKGVYKETPVIPMIQPRKIPVWRNVAAGIMILTVAGVVYWKAFMPRKNVAEQPVAAAAAIAGKPGGDRAVLTLEDGRQINLDSVSTGAIMQQDNANISKLASGQLAYTVLHGKPTATSFNTLSTPRAGQFSLVLPDGSRVWLNNASSLRYPTAFGSSRAVALTGEAFFEVAKDASRPFSVTIHHSGAGEDGGTIQVSGTSFNVMAYPDESTERTTLVEGKIRFTRQGASQVLEPAQQSVVDAKGNQQLVREVNVGEVTAWKNGYFHFDHSTLEGTMRQLARWYDVDVEYKGPMTEQAFVGKIQRNLPLDVILKGLENEHIHFRLEGRKLLVLP